MPKNASNKPGSGGKAVAKPSSGKARKQAQAARSSKGSGKKSRPARKKTSTKRSKRMTGKKHDDDDRRHEDEHKRAEAERHGRGGPARDTKEGGAYREAEMGSTQPSQTTMANPGPENRPFTPEPPTEDPMATPQHSTLPNPPSAPGGDQTGDPNMTPTGERLPEDHPDYRPVNPPDHRSAAEKQADKDK